MADDNKIKQEMKADRLFEMYDALGEKRSLQALWRECVRLRREGVEVPTTTRGVIYTLAAEYKFDERLQQRELLRNTQTQEALEQIRKRGYDNVALLLDKSVQALSNIIDQGDRDSVRLEAIKVVLDRVGVLGLDKMKGLLPIPDSSANKGPSPDPTTADDETLMNYLREQQRL